MTDLSPAAQAVLDAVEDDCIHPDDKHRLAAAALRAAADQVVPEYETTPRGSKVWPCDPVPAIRAALLAIADELEGAGAE